MNLTSSTFIAGLAFCALLSCKKSTTNIDAAVKPPADTPKVVKGVDVYLTGTSKIPGSSVNVATYWKNGVMRKISDSTSSTATVARDIAVSGNNIYLLGNRAQATVYWRNGAEVASLTGNGSGMILNGEDVYIYGSTINQGKQIGRYWKNGVSTDLDKSTQLSAMAIKGADVYAVGFSQTANGKFIAAYWKNGVRTVLTTDSSNHSFAHSIVFNGNDVYIGGQSAASQATYWKNGVPVSLSTGASSSVNAIGVVNGDLYCFGYRKELASAGNACYWKNGVLNDLIGDPSSTINSKITGIAIVGPDVYLSGSYGAPMAYWKGATMITYASTATISYTNIKLVERY